MSSNYPPGVTGREPQIAGPDAEREEEHTCGAKDIELRNINQQAIDSLMTARAKLVALTQYSFPGDIPQLSPKEKRQIAVDVYRLLNQVGYGISDGATVDCPFTGDVTVEYIGGTGWWECPLCGTEHEIEWDDPRDPDA